LQTSQRDHFKVSIFRKHFREVILNGVVLPILLWGIGTVIVLFIPIDMKYAAQDHILALFYVTFPVAVLFITTAMLIFKLRNTRSARVTKSGVGVERQVVSVTAVSVLCQVMTAVVTS
jgi:hypothetical protein